MKPATSMKAKGYGNKLALIIVSASCVALFGQSFRAASHFSGGGHFSGASHSSGGGRSFGGGHSSGGRSPKSLSYSTRPYSTYTYRVYNYPNYPIYRYPVYGFSGAEPKDRPRAELSLVRLHEFEKASGYDFGRPGYEVVFGPPVRGGGSGSTPHPEWRTRAGAKAATKWEQ